MVLGCTFELYDKVLGVTKELSVCYSELYKGSLRYMYAK